MKTLSNLFVAGLIVAMGSLVAGCGKSDTVSSAASGPATGAAPATVPKVASNSDGMPALAHKNNCVACHAINKRVVGPAWRDVAEKYKGVKTYSYRGKEYPLVEGLVMKVSQGGAGNWGSMPMPPNDPSGSKKAEIAQLVEFVLGLAK